MKNLDLLRFAGKKNGDAFQATDWNEFVQAIGQLNIPNLQPGKIERLSGESWADITSSGSTIAAGGTIRLSGYFPNKLTISGTPTEVTKVILNDCAILTDAGSCLEYICESEKMVVVSNPGTENYFIQTSEDSTYEKKGAIHSEDDLVLTGTGVVYINNEVGHGVRGSKLELKGDGSVFVKAGHDAFHGSQVLDIYHGNYFVYQCNDPFGTGVRAAGEELKLRGIIRVFGGNFHIFGMGENAYVFDAQYSYMDWDDTTHYAYTTGDDESGANIDYTYHSGFHCLEFLVDGPAVTESNLANNFTDRIPHAAGVVRVGGMVIVPTQDQQGNNLYAIDYSTPGISGYEIDVEGYVEGTILVSTATPEAEPKGPEIHLKGAFLVAPISGDHAGKAIEYTYDAKNVQVQTDKGSESNYIIGSIHSVKNVKISPKANSVLHCISQGTFSGDQFSGAGIFGSTVMFCNGGGSVYITGFANGCIGTELWIGNDDSKPNKRDRTKNFKGDIYAFGNSQYDMVARLNSSKDNKGYFRVTDDYEGNVFIGKAKTSQAYKSAQSATSGRFIGETNQAGKIFYKKHSGEALTLFDCASKYSEIDEAMLVKKFE